MCVCLYVDAVIDYLCDWAVAAAIVTTIRCAGVGVCPAHLNVGVATRPIATCSQAPKF